MRVRTCEFKGLRDMRFIVFLIKEFREQLDRVTVARVADVNKCRILLYKRVQVHAFYFYK